MVWESLRFAEALDDKLSTKACPGGSKFGNQKKAEEQYLCYCFPPWLVQVEVNLVARHPNQIAPSLATIETSSTGNDDTTAARISRNS